MMLFIQKITKIPRSGISVSAPLRGLFLFYPGRHMRVPPSVTVLVPCEQVILNW